MATSSFLTDTVLTKEGCERLVNMILESKKNPAPKRTHEENPYKVSIEEYKRIMNIK